MIRHLPFRAVALLAAASLFAAACGDDASETSTEGVKSPTPVTITLVTHDSFAVTDGLFDQFTDETGIKVDLLSGGDAGSALNQAILTKDNPEGDVFFGVDNTFLSRALEEDLFVPYESEGLDRVDESLILDEEHRVTPMDTGDVCINYDKAALADLDVDVPTGLADLTEPAYEGLTVVENPATSSPGLSFLLASVSEFGEDGWTDFWEDLEANDLEVVDDWDTAYNVSFSANGGDRPIVVSYASSPAAEVLFAETPVDESPTGAVLESCFRQIEFAGVLANSEHPEEAGQLIDFMLSDAFQSDIPENMFVYPVTDVELPEVFAEHAQLAEDPLTVDPETIAANRDEWIKTWTDIVLR